MTVISIYGGMGAGKDTLALNVQQEFAIFGVKTELVSFAGGLKKEMNQLIALYQSGEFSNKGIATMMTAKEKEVEHFFSLIEDELKEDGVKSTLRTPNMRKAMQYWGSTVRRGQSKSYWIDKLNEKIETLSSDGVVPIITDARFLNELTFVKELERSLLFFLNISKETRKERIFKRDGFYPSDEVFTHASEVEMESFNDKFPEAFIMVKETLSPEEAAKLIWESFTQNEMTFE